MTVFNSKNNGLGVAIETSCLSQFMGPYTSMITSGILETRCHTPQDFQISSGYDPRLLDLGCEEYPNLEGIGEFQNFSIDSGSIEISNALQSKIEKHRICQRLNILETPITSEETIIFLGISKILYLSDTANGRLRKSIVSPWRDDSAFSMHSIIDLVEYATRSAMYKIFRRECKDLVEIELDHLCQMADMEHNCTCTFVKFCEDEIRSLFRRDSIKSSDIGQLSMCEESDFPGQLAYFLVINFFLHVLYELVRVLEGSEQ